MLFQKRKIKDHLSKGLKEIDLSNYPFGKVREVLEELGYRFSDSKYEFVELDDWVNGWQLDYWAYIFKDEEYTGYLIEGSFWYGTCKIVYYGLCD